MSSQFNASVYKTWFKDTKPEYMAKELKLRAVMAEFIGK
jgi:hypothetical protein